MPAVRRYRDAYKLISRTEGLIGKELFKKKTKRFVVRSNRNLFYGQTPFRVKPTRSPVDAVAARRSCGRKQ